jgi:hypothetical protein
MKQIHEIYKYLIEYLSEIKVEDYWDTTEDEDGKTLVNEVLFNGKNWSGFLEELDRILHFTKKELEEFVDIENISTKQVFEIEKIIDVVASDLISNKSLKILGNCEKDTEVFIKSIVADIVAKLHKHKNSWNLKTASKIDHPGNLPLRWNENINKLVDIFYQLSHELKNGEKEPLLSTSKMNLTNFIVNNFVDETGNNLSVHTVYTILKENKMVKRPTSEKRVQIKYLPM